MVLVERLCPKCRAICLSTDLVCASCGVSLKVTRPLGEEVSNTLSSLQLTHHLRENQLFKGRYRVVREVGVGGFGAVYEAVDTQRERRVAIKEISLTGLTPQQMIEATGSFNREVQLLSSLNHTSIPRMHEQLTDAENWYLVMDFIAGETLETRLARAKGDRIPLDQALRIGIQLCAVLEYLHSRQPVIIFRDVKPANIMLTPDEKLYLIDFGVARQYAPGKVRDTIAFGSPGYAAPEQYGKAQTTPRSDIYSLGALLHQMLSGQDPSLSPFHFQPLRTYNQKLPVELEELVKQMLELDMEQRPASMASVRRRLQEITSPQKAARQSKTKAVSAAPAPRTSNAFSTLGVTVTMYREHRAPIKALAWSPDSRLIASWSDDRQVSLWHAFSPRPTSPWPLASGAVYDLTWSAQGKVLAAVRDSGRIRLWSLDTRSNWWQRLTTSLGFHCRIYDGHTDPISALSWSPDGLMIASAERRGLVHVWDTLTLERLQAFKAYSSLIEHIAWSPDGQWIAASSIHRVRIWKATTGKKIWEWQVSSGTTIRALKWSPDGNSLACGASDGSVSVRDLWQGNHSYTYRGHKDALTSLAWSPDGRRIASASVDGTIQVWDALNGRRAFIYDRHENSVLVIAWSPDGQHLASADQDWLVHVWKAV